MLKSSYSLGVTNLLKDLIFGKPHIEKKGGQYVNEGAKLMGDRIVSSFLSNKIILSQLVHLTMILKLYLHDNLADMPELGNFVESGQHDILNEALGTHEHLGRVRTKSLYFTQREVFKKPPGDFKSSQESQVLLEREKHSEKKFKAMEDQFQTQESWWSQKFK